MPKLGFRAGQQDVPEGVASPHEEEPSGLGNPDVPHRTHGPDNQRRGVQLRNLDGGNWHEPIFRCKGYEGAEG